MKFLTISTYKDTLSALPPEERRKLSLADVEWLLEFKKKMGDKFSFYSVVGWGRLVSIGEYDSVEEYAQTLQAPTNQAGFSNIECYPLIEVDDKLINTYLEQLKAAK